MHVVDMELPIRDLEWYKKRYEDLRDDLMKLNKEIDSLKKEKEHGDYVMKSLRKQISDAQDYIAFLWDDMNDLTSIKGEMESENDNG